MIDLKCGDTALIQAACARHGATVQQTAYILATGWWETARTMKPVREGFYLGDRAAAFRRSLRYWPWYGRGQVQLTWEANYRKAGAEVGADLIADPDLALSAEIAAEVLVQGSLEGWPTTCTTGLTAAYCTRLAVGGIGQVVHFGDVWLDNNVQTLPDISQVATQNKCRMIDPKGASGEKITGKPPAVFLSGKPTEFSLNRGTGGGLFVPAGATLTDSGLVAA